ncbi:MAG: arginine N-succinyltransferase [Planctomycetota bacterium]|nr:arginine N-succinyltransferase [Planctomycetota bacterium]MDA1106003.1 arginine N-succinyltransferase [Planctomycetota bacterium]
MGRTNRSQEQAFLIRQASIDDLPVLLKLARMVHFINLPADRDLLSEKIATSRRSFFGLEKDPKEMDFMFVMEEVHSGSVVGTSAVIPRVSWKGHPNLYFQVRRRQHVSEDLGTGQVHETIQLCADESGPSEVGGLILSPGFRRHPQRLGNFLSQIRFHYMGLHPKVFAPRVLAEMMGALGTDGSSPLWESLGRRFINLSFTEADLFSAKSKEFIQSLFPSVEIYTSLLPADARRLLAEVGDETRAAVHMLERQGFVYRDQCDPFDGGPYLEVATDQIPLVKATKRMKLLGADTKGSAEVMVSHHAATGFRAMRCRASVDAKGIWLPRAVAGHLHAEDGDRIGVTLLKGAATQPPRGASILADKRADAAPIEPGHRAAASRRAASRGTTRR